MATLADVSKGTSPESGQSPAMLWGGRILTALPALMLTLSAAGKLSHASQVVEAFSKQFGYPESSLTPIGILELTCAILFVVPRTAILGGILVAAYLGGATATHVRVGDPFFAPVILGALAWVGLYLRDDRLRELFPLRAKKPS
jgi:hypothetical protein